MRRSALCGICVQHRNDRSSRTVPQLSIQDSRRRQLTSVLPCDVYQTRTTLFEKHSFACSSRSQPRTTHRTAIHSMSLADTKVLVNPDAVKRSLKMICPKLKGRQMKTVVFDISSLASVASTVKGRLAGIVEPDEWDTYQQHNGYRRQLSF